MSGIGFDEVIEKHPLALGNRLIGSPMPGTCRDGQVMRLDPLGEPDLSLDSVAFGIFQPHPIQILDPLLLRRALVHLDLVDVGILLGQLIQPRVLHSH